MNMNQNIEEIFTPSTGVEIILNLNSLNPIAASSIIYDTNHNQNIIVVAQPLRNITPSTPFDEMHLTTLLKVDINKKRFGIKCKPLTFHRDYALFDNSKVGAITVEYTPNLIETNIRSAYRMQIGSNFKVKAKLIFNNNSYYSNRDFFVRDISINGLGVAIPIKLNGKPNSLATLKRHNRAVVGLLLIIPSSKQPFATIPLKVEVTRVNQSHSENHIFVGLKFIGLTPDKDVQLNKFIHMAQLDELRRLSRIDVT
ncbi:MAG: PilZ domain-containing protein [Desulfamplus sp.]|nr:PilZ domain-containing protein [Desulfamplus sp.]MBF0388948.1 PilZ domain-containing protein [Desulfamplus sp.]